MAKAKVTSLDGLSDELKKEYKAQADGTFLLIVDEVDGWALEDITGLRNTVGTTRDERDKLQRLLKAWDKLGVTADEATDLIAQARKFAEIDPKNNEATIKAQVDTRVEAATKDLASKHSKELEGKETRINTLTGQVEKLLKRQKATEAIVAAKGNPKLLLPIVEQHAVLDEGEDGEMKLHIVDDKKKVRYGKGGAEMDFEQLVEEIKAGGEYAGAFESETLEGTGLEGRHKKPLVTGSKRRSEMSEVEQAAYINAHGKSNYLSLPL